MKEVLQYLFFLFLSAALTGCGGEHPENAGLESQNVSDTAKKSVEPSYKIPKDTSELLASAKQLLGYFFRDNFDSITPYIHPQKGIRLVPMVRIENHHRPISRDSFSIKLQSRDSVLWGYGDGSGLPLWFPYVNYKKQFICNRNYLRTTPKLCRWPLHFTLTKGNVQDVFPGAWLVDFTENPTEDHDWGSVVFVYEKTQTGYFVVAVLSNYWTI